MITAAKEKYFPAIIELWEGSVRATHHFLPEEYLQQIKTLLPSILPAVQLFILHDRNQIAGFLGVAKRKSRCYLFVLIGGERG